MMNQSQLPAPCSAVTATTREAATCRSDRSRKWHGSCDLVADQVGNGLERSVARERPGTPGQRWFGGLFQFAVLVLTVSERPTQTRDE